MLTHSSDGGRNRIYHKAQEMCIFVYVMHCVMRLTFVQAQCTIDVYTGAVGWSALLLGHKPLSSIFICIYSPGSVYICVCNTVHNAMYRDYPTWQTGTVVEYSVSFYSRSLKPVPGVCLVTDKDPHG